MKRVDTNASSVHTSASRHTRPAGVDRPQGGINIGQGMKRGTLEIRLFCETSFKRWCNSWCNYSDYYALCLCLCVKAFISCCYYKLLFSVRFRLCVRVCTRIFPWLARCMEIIHFSTDLKLTGACHKRKYNVAYNVRLDWQKPTFCVWLPLINNIRWLDTVPLIVYCLWLKRVSVCLFLFVCISLCVFTSLTNSTAVCIYL